ncbi:hypothetical protein Aperf_G00000012060 [Anoplocephala perfoliata]
MQNTGDVSRSSNEEEPPLSVQQPLQDAFFCGDERIIEDLLYDQIRYHTPPGFCHQETISNAIWMRRTLINWLREVCEHRDTKTEVLAHTVQLIDRFVAANKTDKREYQLVGAACFLISSKIKETYPVPVEHLVRYTDYSINKNELLTKELLVTISLNCDLSMITVSDFIKPLIDRVPCEIELRELIRKSANQLIHKVIHVEGLNWFLPSYVATTCILYAIQLITEPPPREELTNKIRAKFIMLLKMDPVKLAETSKYFQSLFKPGTADLADAVTSIDRGEGAADASLENRPADDVPDTPTETSSSYHSSSSTSSGHSICNNSVNVSGLCTRYEMDHDLTSFEANASNEVVSLLSPASVLDSGIQDRSPSNSEE